MAHQHARIRWRAAQRVVKAVHAFLREALAERDVLRRIKTRDIEKKRTIAAERRASNAHRSPAHHVVIPNGEPWYPDIKSRRAD